jgi:polysaccharide biosynthesis PFTS motif protein
MFKFIIVYIFDLLLSVIYLLIGNSGNAIMLPELTLYRSVNFLGSNNTAGHYLFHYTWTIYRPLWTYIAEERGSRISIYFTTANAMLKSPFGENNNSFEYYPSSWPEYIVWSEYHKEEIKKYCVNNPKIFVENHIPFSTLKHEIIKVPKKSILVFDIEPKRLIKSIKNEVFFSAHAEYIHYNKFIFRKFFNDIINTASQNGFTVFLKRKRVLFEYENIFYKKFIRDLEKKDCFYSLDPDINAIDFLNNHPGAVIGSPFTSVPYVAKMMNKSSIYYDPINYIFKNDKNSNNVPIIRGVKDLSKWFKSIGHFHRD